MSYPLAGYDWLHVCRYLDEKSVIKLGNSIPALRPLLVKVQWSKHKFTYRSAELADKGRKNLISSLKIDDHEFNQIGKFPNLKELEIENGHFFFFYDREFKVSRSNLPRGIRRLRLKLYSKLMIFNLPESIRDLEITNCKLQLGTDILPSRLKYLKLDICTDPLPLSIFPKGLRRLELVSYCKDLEAGLLPDSIKTLILGKSRKKYLTIEEYHNRDTLYRSHHLSPGVIPSNLKTLEINWELEPFERGVFPDSITDLSLSNFNSPIKLFSLPSNLRILRFGPSFNSKILRGVLPDNLSELYFGDSFNKKIDVGTFPKSLKILEFGKNFNKPFKKGCLPEGLEALKLGRYDRQLGPLPKSLRSFKIEWYGKPLKEGELPDGLEVFKIGGSKYPFETRSIPESITKLTLGRSFNQPILRDVLPDSIKDLWIRDPHYKERIYVNRNLRCITFDGFYKIPPVLTNLGFKSLYLGSQNRPATSLGSQNRPATSLGSQNRPATSFGNLDHKPEEKYIHIRNIDHIRRGNLPEGLERLTLGDDISITVRKGLLPKSLRYLNLGNSFTKGFEYGSLPPKLEYLNVGNSFNKQIRSGILPASLKRITLPPRYKYHLPNDFKGVDDFYL